MGLIGRWGSEGGGINREVGFRRVGINREVGFRRGGDQKGGGVQKGVGLIGRWG